MQRRHFVAGLVLPTVVSLPAAAQTAAPAWPQRPIRLVVAYPAGSSPDVVARMLTQRLSLGQPFVIDNRAGAGGNLGTGVVAKSAADGHTFLFTTQSPLVSAPALIKQMPYDPVRELMPVTQVATAPLLLTVDARLGLKNVDDLVKLAKSKPGELNYGSTGNGQATHLSMELFKSRSGTQIVHVPYQSSPAAVTAILGGQIQASFMVPSVAMPHVQAGRLSPLGMTSATRLPSLPDIPTIAEQGFPGYELVAWHAVMAPAGTAPAIVERVASELGRLIRGDELRTALLAQHFAPSGAGPQELAAIIQRETTLWARVAQAAGVQPE